MVPQGDNEQNSGLIDLQLQNITKRFGKLEVVRDVSLTVRKGEICCLLGPSGCGKTTALKIVAGLIDLDSGTVRLAGRDITRLSPQRRDLGFVFQNYALFPHMSTYDNVAYGLHRRRLPKSEIKQRVARALQLMRLKGYESRRTHELSGGEQQRIALARALVIEPKALLLDEPLSNLDARLRSDMRHEIRHIQRELNITTLYVTHDQEEAMSIADSVAVMNRGKIEQVGSPREIYDHPASQFVADFIGGVNFLQGLIENDTLALLGHSFPLKANNLPTGTEVICAIRPERIAMTEPDSSLPSAIVEEITYLGAFVHHRVRLEDAAAKGVQLNVETTAQQAVYEVGQRVGLKVRHDDFHIFPAHSSNTEKLPA